MPAPPIIQVALRPPDLGSHRVQPSARLLHRAPGFVSLRANGFQFGSQLFAPLVQCGELVGVGLRGAEPIPCCSKVDSQRLRVAVQVCALLSQRQDLALVRRDVALSSRQDGAPGRPLCFRCCHSVVRHCGGRIGGAWMSSGAADRARLPVDQIGGQPSRETVELFLAQLQPATVRDTGRIIGRNCPFPGVRELRKAGVHGGADPKQAEDLVDLMLGFGHDGSCGPGFPMPLGDLGCRGHQPCDVGLEAGPMLLRSDRHPLLLDNPRPSLRQGLAQRRFFGEAGVEIGKHLGQPLRGPCVHGVNTGPELDHPSCGRSGPFPCRPSPRACVGEGTQVPGDAGGPACDRDPFGERRELVLTSVQVGQSRCCLPRLLLAYQLARRRISCRDLFALVRLGRVPLGECVRGELPGRAHQRGHEALELAVRDAVPGR